MPTEREAVTALENLGLTEYEAKCYVALTRVSEGSAKEISQLSEVPRARVYDVVDRLHQRGLVDVQESDPRQYRAIPRTRALDVLRQTYDAQVEAASAALAELETANSPEERGVWAVANAEHVTERAVALLEDAEEHVSFIVADESVVDEEILDQLAATSSGETTVVAEVPTEETRDRMRDSVPDAEVSVDASLRDRHKVVEKWPGQLIMVDNQAVLASGVEESELPTMSEETAVWTAGRDHGFATWIRELLDDRQPDREPEGS